jgi:hypothetical protein
MVTNLYSGGCHTKHPKMPIVVGGQTYYVSGGSCTSPTPAYQEHDVIIPLDWGYRSVAGKAPWDDAGSDKPTPEVHPYLIKDMTAPEDPIRFAKMIEYVASQILAGKKVFVGCIGGHGRTGTVLAALVAHMTGEKDAITYVRKHYCDHAVETTPQVNFLHKHFGIKKIDGYKSKGWDGYGHASHSGKAFKDFPPTSSKVSPKGGSKAKNYIGLSPIKTPRSLFV